LDVFYYGIFMDLLYYSFFVKKSSLLILWVAFVLFHLQVSLSFFWILAAFRVVGCFLSFLELNYICWIWFCSLNYVIYLLFWLLLLKELYEWDLDIFSYKFMYFKYLLIYLFKYVNKNYPILFFIFFKNKTFVTVVRGCKPI